MKSLSFYFSMALCLIVAACTDSPKENNTIYSSQTDTIFNIVEADTIHLKVSYTSVDSLSSVEIYPYATASIVKNKNSIYSGSASLAWKELQVFLKKDPLVLLNAPQWLSKLQKDPLNKKDLDQNALTIIIGDGNAVADEMSKQSGIQHADSLRGHTLAIQVRYFKKLSFPPGIGSSDDLRGAKQDFSFEGKKVQYNFISGKDIANPSLYKIYDYQNDDHFIIQLPVRNDSSEVYLAKIPSQGTLEKTFEYAMNRVAKKYKTNFNKKDKLAFPTITFDLFKNYQELKKPIAGSDLSITRFEQYLDFKLDYEGITIRDEMLIAVDSVVIAKKEMPARKLYFDKPFLIILKEKKSKHPYFLMWVENAEFMSERNY